jgi:hypothetical protein
MTTSQERKAVIAKRQWFIRELVVCGISLGDIARFLDEPYARISAERYHIPDYDVLTRDLPDRRCIPQIAPLVQAKLSEVLERKNPVYPEHEKKLVYFLNRWLRRYEMRLMKKSLDGMDPVCVVKRLRVLGIPRTSVSELTNTAHQTVYKQLIEFGEMDALSKEAKANRHRCFELVFLEYAKTFCSSNPPAEGISNIKAYRALLARWLEVDHLLVHLHAYLKAIQDISIPDDDEGSEPYRRLLTDLRAPINEGLPAKLSAEEIWKELLFAIGNNRAPAPSDREGCLHYLETQARKRMHHHFLPSIILAVTRLIDLGIAKLDKKEALCLCSYYGIGKDQHTHKEVGLLLGCTRQRSHQIVSDALEHLRNDDNIQFALVLTEHPARLQDKILEQAAEYIHLQLYVARVIKSKNYPFDPSILTRNPLDENLSVRTHNRLMRNSIKTVRDLVLTTSKELLQINGFGKTCLQEVKSYLAKHKLRLGMHRSELPPEAPL